MNESGVMSLDDALALSEPMLEAARAGEWARVALLNEQCEALLSKGYPTDEEGHAGLLSLQACYEDLRSLTSAAREKTASDLGLHRQSHRALSAYLQTSDAS